ncbi:MAG: hypothetical protein ABIH47_01055 [Candidatus Omnitrophota bacterium]
MGVIRIKDEHWFWLMNIRQAGSIDDVLSLLHDHYLDCGSLQHRVNTELTKECLNAKKKGSDSIPQSHEPRFEKRGMTLTNGCQKYDN